MTSASHFRSIRILLFIAIAFVMGESSLHGESLSSVLKSPASYHHKRITLVGILRGEGPMFELFENEADAVAMTAPKSIYMVAPPTWKKGGPYDLRRARVTGVVDAKRHGIWGNPCALTPEKIEVLSGPVAPWPDLVVVFRNEKQAPVVLHLGTPPSNSDFTLQPKECIDVGGWAGEDKQATPVRALSARGALVAKTEITIRRSRPYYDPMNAALYYRITNGRIEKVLPSVAKNWGWRR